MSMEERTYLPPKSLEGVPRNASLGDEIAFLHLRISRLARSRKKVDDQQLLRMMSVLTRMVAVQAKLGEDGPSELAVIAERARRRLIEAGLRKGDAEG